ncbi:hypothetical protein SGLAM104S_01298 [Streptomyces glaucescens]
MKTATPVQRKVARPRADALRNRERIVTAAREMSSSTAPRSRSTTSPAGPASAMPRCTATSPTVTPSSAKSSAR